MMLIFAIIVAPVVAVLLLAGLPSLVDRMAQKSSGRDTEYDHLIAVFARRRQMEAGLALDMAFDAASWRVSEYSREDGRSAGGQGTLSRRPS
jgi:hypothetical protein